MKTKKLILCALFTAIICIVAPFAVMIGPVPVTFTLFALALAAFCTGSVNAAISVAVYILTGLAGMPVFSGFKSGFSAIMSPAGGFVFSYVFVVLILGFAGKAKKKSAVVLWCTLALVVCYIFGTLWYMFIAKADLITALTLCILPFIPFDVMKLYAAYAIAKVIKKRVK